MPAVSPVEGYIVSRERDDAWANATHVRIILGGSGVGVTAVYRVWTLAD